MEANDLISSLTQSLKNMNNSFTSKLDMSGIDDCEDEGEEEKETVQEVVPRNSFNFGSNDVNIDDIHKDFKCHVRELAEIEDMINKYNDLIKKLKDKKKELRNNTITHMLKHEIDVANMNDNDKFSLVTVKRIINPAAKSRLQDKLKEYFLKEENVKDSKKADEKAKKIFKWLYDTADTKIDQSLRRYKK